MGALNNGQRSVVLSGRVEVGRGPTCALRLARRRASNLHARISWNGAGWLLRDLGSTNGTFVDGVRLPPGVDRHLQEGARLAFGEVEEVWTLSDASPPSAIAEDLRGDRQVSARSGMLSLPSDDEIHAMLLERPDGRWVVELPGGVREVVDGEYLELPGSTWRIRLPCISAATPRSEADEGEAFALTFNVGADEETIELVLSRPDRQIRIPSRACHYVLLTLARARLADHAAGFGALQAGWREVDDLCRLVDLDELHLNVQVYRLRRQLAEAGVPSTIVERRAGERRLRIGCARLVVRPV